MFHLLKEALVSETVETDETDESHETVETPETRLSFESRLSRIPKIALGDKPLLTRGPPTRNFALLGVLFFFGHRAFAETPETSRTSETLETSETSRTDGTNRTSGTNGTSGRAWRFVMWDFRFGIGIVALSIVNSTIVNWSKWKLGFGLWSPAYS